MSEEQIINYIKRDIEETTKQIENGDLMLIEDNEKIRIAVLQSILDLYNKEKETSHFLQSQLDEANAKLIKEKENNKKLKEDKKYYIIDEISEEIDKLLEE